MVRYHAVQYDTVQYKTIRYNTMRYKTIRYGAASFYTVRYNIARYSSTRCGIFPHTTSEGKERFNAPRGRLIARGSFVRVSIDRWTVDTGLEPLGTFPPRPSLTPAPAVVNVLVWTFPIIPSMMPPAEPRRNTQQFSSLKIAKNKTNQKCWWLTCLKPRMWNKYRASLAR